MKWNTINPKKEGSYICDLGAFGVCLCWWDNNNWVKMWSSEQVKIWGWIEIPKYK
jgi:hypothetical protein